MKAELIKNNGSLLENQTHIISSFDLSKSNETGIITNLTLNHILNHSIKGFRKDYRKERNINIINGMGVTLGDSIIGINALDCIKKLNKNIKITLIRPASCRPYIEEVYNIPNALIDNIHYMPYELSKLQKNPVNIDIGNQLYWSDFNTLEMHDFFLKSLGIEPATIPDEWKRNYWLQDYLPASLCNGQKYVLFCPNASTRLRAIPEKYHLKIIDLLYSTYNLPVYGFSSVQHPKFRNVTLECRDTRKFINMISNASYVYTCDSSALHISAGYDIPTTCVFTSIPPDLRSKYYNRCSSIYIGDAVTKHIHESEDPTIIDYVNSKFERYYDQI